MFARAWGECLGKIQCEDPATRVEAAWSLAGENAPRQVHVFPRDERLPGEDDYQPCVSSEAEAALAGLRSAVPAGLGEFRFNEVVPWGEEVLDCILVSPEEWWLGRHWAVSNPARCVGGAMPTAAPPNMVSRAYLKMAEALAWSGLPIEPGQRAAEIGSSPGGACQVLLEHGLHVWGIDPAEMHEAVLKHPRFTHIRKRAKDMKRREFQNIRWLMADANVAPNYTLDTVEAIVTHASVRIRGLLLTLKLGQWKLAQELPGWLERVRSWGYRQVKARQLAHNRREICVAALRSGKFAEYSAG